MATGDQHLDLLAKFLLICPNSITDVTEQTKNILHIAPKKGPTEGFQILGGMAP